MDSLYKRFFCVSESKGILYPFPPSATCMHSLYFLLLLMVPLPVLKKLLVDPWHNPEKKICEWWEIFSTTMSLRDLPRDLPEGKPAAHGTSADTQTAWGYEPLIWSFQPWNCPRLRVLPVQTHRALQVLGKSKPFKLNILGANESAFLELYFAI